MKKDKGKNSKLKDIIPFMLFAGLIYQSHIAFAATLTVSLDNPPQSGVIELQLFDSANTFISQQNPFKTMRYNLVEPQPFRIENVPGGEYALRIYHDANNNNLVDKNFIGIPVEPIGFSNRYRPKAPPSFKRAMFKVTKDETRHFNVQLYKPLGEQGQIGVGIGLISRSSPYREYNGGVNQLIPAITFIGDRLQVFGPRIQWSLASSKKLRLALAGQYRIGVYEEKDSPFLNDMGDRQNTFIAGLAVQAELPAGVDLEIAHQYDVLDRIGGAVSSLGISKAWELGSFRITPRLGYNYLSAEFSNYDFGVPADKATTSRPAYQLGSTTSIEAGIGLTAEITRQWVFILNMNIEKLSDEVKNSPLVSEDSVVKGFAAINYAF